MQSDPVETHRVLYALMLGRSLSEHEAASIRAHWGSKQIDPAWLATRIRDSEEYRARRKSAELEASAWKPFAEAPRDGTLIDVWDTEKGRVPNLRWLTGPQAHELDYPGDPRSEATFKPEDTGWYRLNADGRWVLPRYTDMTRASHFIVAPPPLA